MISNWQRLCQITEKIHNEKEEKVQMVFGQVFSLLFGYDTFNGEVDSHRPLHIGATDRVIPDIIIRDSSINRDLFIVELKRLNLRFDRKYAEQLISYMRLLCLNVGILVCDAIYIYVLVDDKPVYCKIDLTPDNSMGESFIELFSKDSYSADRVKTFVLSQEQSNGNIEKIIEELRAIELSEIVKLYFASSFEEAEIDKALESFEFIIREVGTNLQPGPNKELIQDWVKRIFRYLFRNNILSEQEIFRLHELEYSKDTFGIRYAMLVDRQRDILDRTGHARYWQKQIGEYYVCSQWWKNQDEEYEDNLNRWLNKVLPNYKVLGLDRHKVFSV